MSNAHDHQPLPDAAATRRYLAKFERIIAHRHDVTAATREREGPRDERRWPALQNHLLAHSILALKLVTIATGFDKDFEDLHPNLLRRIHVGPMYSHAFTEQTGPLREVLAEAAGEPGLDWALSESIDSYQGKSAQNTKAFFRSVIDPHVIGFGTIDDIDQIAGKRGDRQSSTGQQEITAVLMESFSGANTVVRGNCTFGMFSNYPENVDDALRQRAGSRFLVDGPQSREDYVDILHLLLGRNQDIPVGEHELFAAQEIKRAVAESYEGHSRPHEEGLIAVFDAVAARIGALDTIAKFGTYLKAIQEADTNWGYPPYLKFDSGNITANAQGLVSTEAQPIWVVVTHYGWRIELLSMFPNAVGIRRATGPDETLVPWFNIVFLTALGALFWTIFNFLRRLRRRHVDPVIDDLEDRFSSAVDSADAGADAARHHATGLYERFQRWLDTWRPKNKRRYRK